LRSDMDLFLDSARSALSDLRHLAVTRAEAMER